MSKLKKIVVWVLIILAAILFWISLRFEEQALEYTLAALAVWAVAFLINKFYQPST